jgi:tripartite-type tricarboxylate transporter receptor subunit TctC
VQKLQTAASETMDMPAVKDRLTGLGAVLVAPNRRSPKYLATFVQSEIAKWAGPIKAAGVISD